MTVKSVKNACIVVQSRKKIKLKQQTLHQLWQPARVTGTGTEAGNESGETTTYSSLLSDPVLDSTESEPRKDWKKVKKIVKVQKHPRQSAASLWGLIMEYCSEECPNLATLTALALAHPVHTAD